ncbi:MAG: ribose 5-phosphate isomerase B [Bacteroidales bacterium]|nr:ribose 5-phosphate isomerase B [Bacteroidales bacterium]
MKNKDGKKIAIACDHAGYKLKEELLDFFRNNEGLLIEDLGTFSPESVDYPDYAHKIATAIEEGKYNIGLTICGSGNGINMTANKHQDIRSALCWNEEISRLARAHNDANICAMPGRFISLEKAVLIVKTFLATPFEGGRHLRRIKKIPLRS